MDQKVALITGGSKGIGLAIAQKLVKEQFRVLICGRQATELDAAIKELQTIEGASVTAQVCDVRKYDQVENLFQTIDQQFGRLDLLVNNAGVGKFANVEKLSVEDWHSVIETNLNSLFYCCHLAIPRLRNSGGGYIFNIGSLAGKNTFPQGAAYSASKFGLIGFSEALMEEVRYDNIRVSYIMPGSVETDFGVHNSMSLEETWRLWPEDVAQVVVDLLHHNPRSLPSRVEIRPAKPLRKR